ncbi:LON peptidase substrate-binding domain-containing protein [Amorphus orientalis]|uniref:Lon protease-like protein n=1 Tax=Amorphus orientalis TaxID=649198 RepID=A0AAE3VRW8_9HYPH|nr:LON peptidase substrate-binding domain-containing protein [Amorphus orientalis]MDQ0317075.1 Lon protease-like protein [Amorphus orientalis]
MRAGNQVYERAGDIPATIPVFPLSGALLLPKVQLPLNIFEPRYMAMIDAAMRTERVIGMVQPRFDEPDGDEGDHPALCAVGCLGRVTTLQESGDGRYLITLSGITRFRIEEELDTATPYRMCRITTEPFASDLDEETEGADVDRDAVLKAFGDYLAANDLEADWKSVREASNEALVNTLAMMSPYGPAEKQALLEAANLKERAETLVAITEIELARSASDQTTTIN